MSEAHEEQELAALRASGAGRELALAAFFERHRPRLERMIRRRMDSQLKLRVDEGDILQETYLEVRKRLDNYLADPAMPPFVWLRFLASQRIVTLYRKHLGAKKRDVRRQVPYRTPPPGMTSMAMAHELVGQMSTPSKAVMREEAKAAIEQALEALSSTDRDVLVLRHFEDLTNLEVAAELGIDPSAASKRYLRAIRRVGQVMRKMGLEGLFG